MMNSKATKNHAVLSLTTTIALTCGLLVPLWADEPVQYRNVFTNPGAMNRVDVGVSITSDIETSYKKLGPGATLPTRFQGPDGKANLSLVRYADEVKKIYAVPIDKEINDAMEVYAGTQRFVFTEGEFDLRAEEWGLVSNLHAVPKIVTSQPFTELPTYEWSYSGPGQRLPVDHRDSSTTILESGTEPNTGSDNATLRLRLGSEPSLSSPGSDQSGWPKQGTVKVTMTPPPNLGFGPVDNQYFINFHLPTENWEEVEKRPLLPDSRDVVPSEVIEFTKGKATEGMSVRELFTAAGPSGLDESIKVWVNSDTIKFWVGLSEADRNNINLWVNILGAYLGGAGGGRAIAGVLKPDVITKLDDAFGTLGKDVAKSAFSEGAARQGWSLFDSLEAPGDVLVIENTWVQFHHALTENSFENLPAHAQENVAKLKVIIGKFNADPHLKVTDLPEEEQVLWGNEKGFVSSVVWKFCRLAAVVELQWEEVEYEGDLYRRNGYDGRITQILRYPTSAYIKPVYVW